MDGLTELIVTDDMHAPKMLMFEHAKAFVALPGGVGTLEGLVEQMTWSQLGRHEKPILLANLFGFWNALLALLDHMRAARFIRRDMDVPYLVADSVEDIVPMLRRAAAQRDQAALDSVPPQPPSGGCKAIRPPSGAALPTPSGACRSPRRRAPRTMRR
jgi:predicted Rossmann-fold nucleotide-binding protein